MRVNNLFNYLLFISLNSVKKQQCPNSLAKHDRLTLTVTSVDRPNSTYTLSPGSVPRQCTWTLWDADDVFIMFAKK